jgi:hypothetical protein
VVRIKLKYLGNGFQKEGEYGVNENGTMRPVETVLRRGRGRIKEKDGRGYLRYIVSTFVNVTVYSRYNCL